MLAVRRRFPIAVVLLAAAGCQPQPVAAAAVPPDTSSSATCHPRFSPARLLLGAGATSGKIRVELPAGCRFRPQVGVDWIRLSPGAPPAAAGPADVSFSLAPNAGADRMGVIAVLGEVVTIVQRGRGPSTGHPRLWIRAEDLPRLRRLATPANPYWKNVMLPRTAEARRAFDTKYFPGGKAAARWPDPANEVEGPGTESVAMQLAFHSLVAADPGERQDAARRGRALIMQVMNEVLRSGAAKGFREERFAVSDRFRYTGEQWALTVDWLYPHLDGRDRTTIRKVFLRWAELQATHSEYFRNRQLRGDPALVADRVETRWAANNWQTAMARNFLLASLVFDDPDDPPLDPGKDVLAPKNSLRAYRDEALRSALYQQHFLFKQGGDASGGIPPEGPFAYGAEASAFLFHGLLALFTAGYVDWERWGAPVGILGERYFRDLSGYYPHAIAPVPDSRRGERLYAAATIEQTREWAMTGIMHVAQLGPIGVLAGLTGDQGLRDRMRWLLTEPLPGGPENRDEHSRHDTSHAVLSFLLHDPALPAPRDYRPDLGLTFGAPAMGRYSARTGWGADARWLHYTCTWKAIDHQIDLCGSFMFWRKGDFITDPRNGYSDSGIIDAPDYHNAFAVEHRSPPGADFEKTTWARGGQTRYNQGDPRTVMSDAPEALYLESDATNLHNQKDRPREVPHASRALVWIKPDTIVIYDRAITSDGNRAKRFWLNFPSAPRIGKQLVEARSPGGQAIRLDVLLPERALIRQRPWEEDPGIGGYEPMVAHVSVDAPGAGAEVRMLHVLAADDSGRAPVAARLLKVDGDPAAFHGAAVAGAVVLFAVRPGAQAQVNLSYQAAPGSQHVITGLTAGQRYDVERAGNQTKIRPGRVHQVDHAGALRFRL
jgi:hypothetical protein